MRANIWIFLNRVSTVFLRFYREDRDPDYKMPETDVDEESETEVESGNEDLEEEVKALIQEAEAPLMEDPQVISPVKVTLTPAKEPRHGEEVMGGEDEVIITLLSGEEGEARVGRPPKLWERALLLTEQMSEYSSGEDEEYVPPYCLDTSLEYDEVRFILYLTLTNAMVPQYSEDGAIVSQDEVRELDAEARAPLQPPPDYVAIWVKVGSVKERIAKAKEEFDESVAKKDICENKCVLKELTEGRKVVDKLTLEMVEAAGKLGEERKPRRERKQSGSIKVGEEADAMDDVINAMKKVNVNETRKSSTSSSSPKTPQKIGIKALSSAAKNMEKVQTSMVMGPSGDQA